MAGLNINEGLLVSEAISLLKQLISTPSFSREEANTALLLCSFLERHGITFKRIEHNIYAQNKYYDENKPTILLNSHHDTVKPNKGYTLDPFDPVEKDGKLYGLGSNDAGGCLVSLIAVFLHFYGSQSLSHNIVFAASAEEEISGVNGIELVLPKIGQIAFGVVGEPTRMQMAVAERGLMVIDCVAHGVAGHAARNEGENALYKALDDISRLRDHRFGRVSDLLGETKTTVTIIETENKQHNVVPPLCRYVIDVRVNELYSFDEILEELKDILQADFKPRSLRMRSTSTPLDHPLVKAGTQLGLGYYGSPTTSDKALMPFCTLKMGPGDSARSHTADEFIFVHEIEEAIGTYIQLLNKIVLK